MDDGRTSLPANWADRCTFACSACDDFTGTSTFEFNVHLNEAHPGFVDPAGGNGRYTMSENVAHQCCACDSWLPWTSLMLESHLRDKHRLTLAEYARGNAEGILRQMEFPEADGAKADAKAAGRRGSSSPAEWFDQGPIV